MNFNADPLLFRDATMVSTARAYPMLTIRGGDIYVAEMAHGKTGDVNDHIARCSSYGAALKMLRDAESWIITEDDASRQHATAYSKIHYKRLRGAVTKIVPAKPKQEVRRVTITISGPEGSGKTLLSEAIERILRDAGIAHIIYDEGKAKRSAATHGAPLAGVPEGLVFLSGRTNVTIKSVTPRPS